jgi:hypothetical protein
MKMTRDNVINRNMITVNEHGHTKEETLLVSMFTALIQPVIRRLPNSLSCVEEPMAGHVGINGAYYKLGKGNTKGSVVAQVESVCVSFPGAFETYANSWEGQNQVIPIQ